VLATMASKLAFNVLFFIMVASQNIIELSITKL